MDFDGDRVHRLQVVHAGLPVRRALHRSRHADRGQVPLLRAPGGGRPRAGLRHRLPGAGHRRRATSTIPIAASRGSSPRSRCRCASREQGTQPKLFYLGADVAALTPAMQRRDGAATSSRRRSDHRAGPAATGRRRSRLRRRMAALDLLAWRVRVYDVAHAERPWGWKVSTYLWTKSIAAGALLVAALAVLVAGSRPAIARWRRSRPVVALRLPRAHHRPPRRAISATRPLPLHPAQGRTGGRGSSWGAWILIGLRRRWRTSGSSPGWAEPGRASLTWLAAAACMLARRGVGRVPAPSSSARRRGATSGRARLLLPASRSWPRSSPAARALLLGRAAPAWRLGARRETLPPRVAVCALAAGHGVIWSLSCSSRSRRATPRRARGIARRPACARRAAGAAWSAAGLLLPIGLLTTSSPAAWTVAAVARPDRPRGSTRTSGSARASPSR